MEAEGKETGNGNERDLFTNHRCGAEMKENRAQPQTVAETWM